MQIFCNWGWGFWFSVLVFSTSFKTLHSQLALYWKVCVILERIQARILVLQITSQGTHLLHSSKINSCSFFLKFKPINHLIPFSSLVTQLTATALENLVVYVVQDLKQVVYDSEGRWFDRHLLSLLQSPWERCWGVALKTSFLPVQGIWQIFQDGEMICGFVVLIS